VISNRVVFHVWEIASEHAGRAVGDRARTWELEQHGQAGAMVDEFLDQQAEEMYIA
jgi:hypothetical protein